MLKARSADQCQVRGCQPVAVWALPTVNDGSCRLLSLWQACPPLSVLLMLKGKLLSVRLLTFERCSRSNARHCRACAPSRRCSARMQTAPQVKQRETVCVAGGGRVIHYTMKLGMPVPWLQPAGARSRSWDQEGHVLCNGIERFVSKRGCRFERGDQNAGSLGARAPTDKTR